MMIKRVVSVLALALALGAVSVGNAYAAGPPPFGAGLELTENGTPASPGAIVEDGQVILGSCVEDSLGKIVNNGDPVDLLQFGPPTYVRCEPDTLSGGVSIVALGDTGTALLLMFPTLTLTTPQPCVYQFAMLNGSFRVGTPYGGPYITGEATGSLNRSGSSASCARTLHTEFAAVEQDSEDQTFGAELTKSPFW